jgi:hypothetical protein
VGKKNAAKRKEGKERSARLLPFAQKVIRLEKVGSESALTGFMRSGLRGYVDDLEALQVYRDMLLEERVISPMRDGKPHFVETRLLRVSAHDAWVRVSAVWRKLNPVSLYGMCLVYPEELDQPYSDFNF